MRKLIFTMAIIASVFNAYAQDSLYINKKGGILISYPISAIDSVSFSINKDSLLINLAIQTVDSYAIAYIDSISFTRTAQKNTSTTDAGVLINGVRWASRNVNIPSTFTSSSEEFGYFYQWNSNVGWPTTGTIGTITATDGTTTWNTSWNGGYSPGTSSDTWISANDPSPSGWRLPTYSEIQSLLNTTYVNHTWTTQNGVRGEKFTDKTNGNSIFLPAAGCRGSNDGAISNSSIYGYYMSSTAYNSLAWRMIFYIGSANCSFSSRGDSRSIRPVAE